MTRLAPAACWLAILGAWGPPAALGRGAADGAVEAALADLDDVGRAHARRLQATQTLELHVDTDPRALPALVQTLGDLDYRVAWGAVLTLRRVGAPAVPALVAALEAAPERDARSYAAQALEGISDPPPVAAIPALVRALEDKDLRWVALETLRGRPSDPGHPPAALCQVPEFRQALPRLRRLWHHPDPRLRRLLFEATRYLDPEAFPRALRDPEPELRLAAARALGELPAEGEALERAFALLADPAPEVRAAAVDPLYRLDDPLAHLPQLLRVAHEDPAPEVRRAAQGLADFAPIVAWEAGRPTHTALPRVFWRELLAFALAAAGVLAAARYVPRSLPTPAHRWGSIAVTCVAPTLGLVCLGVYAHDYLGDELWTLLTADLDLPWAPFWLGAPLTASGVFALGAVWASGRPDGPPLFTAPDAPGN